LREWPRPRVLNVAEFDAEIEPPLRERFEQRPGRQADFLAEVYVLDAERVYVFLTEIDRACSARC
jgi:hypothetical protein